MNRQDDVSPVRCGSALLLLLGCALLCGCAVGTETRRVLALAARTTQHEPRFFEYLRSDRLAQREARLLAEQAWAEVVESVPNASPDYENGFMEGFADYLYRGGSGEPPAVPPRGYWNLRFLNQFGRATTKAWFDGFRHGAQDCKTRGLREMWLVPLSLVDNEADTQETPPPSDVRAPDPSPIRVRPSDLPNARDDQVLLVPESPPTPESAEESSVQLDLTDEESPQAAVTDEPQPSESLPDRITPQNEESLRDILEEPPQEPASIPMPNDGFTDPFGDDTAPELELPVQPEDQQDPFNLPENEDDTDFDDFDLNNAFDDPAPEPMPFQSSASRPSALGSADNGKIRQTSAEHDARPRDIPIANTLRPRKAPNRVVRGVARKEEPMRLVFDGPPKQASASNPSSLEPHTPDRAATRSLNPARLRGQHAFLNEFLFGDDLPTLPLRIDSGRRSSNRDTTTSDIDAVDSLPDLDFDTVKRWASEEGPSTGAGWTHETPRSAELPLRVLERSGSLQGADQLPKIINQSDLPAGKESNSSTLNWRIRD